MGHATQQYLDLGASAHLDLLHAAHKSGIAIAVNNASNDGGWHERSYPKQEAIEKAATLPLTGADCYVSQQAIKYNHHRSIAHLSCLTAFYVDLDTYHTQYNHLDAIDIFRLVQHQYPDLPMPTITAHSGRGRYLIWALKKTKTTALLPTWQQIEDVLVDAFKEYGADPMARDAARMLRVADTVNTKSNTRASMQQAGEPITYEAMLRFSNAYRKANKPEPQARTQARPSAVIRPLTKKNAYTLAHCRMQDYRAIAGLRGGRYTDHRRRAIFYFACAAAWFYSDPEELRREVQVFIDDCIAEPEKYKTNIVNSVITRKQTQLDGIKLTWQGKEVDSRYKAKNITLITTLGISRSEQTHLKTIIGQDEKRHRNTVATRAKRRKAGVIPRHEYLAPAQDRKQQALDLREQGLNQVQIARELGISRGAIQSYFRK